MKSKPKRLSIGIIKKRKNTKNYPYSKQIKKERKMTNFAVINRSTGIFPDPENVVHFAKKEKKTRINVIVKV